ncbi:XRE family transcriptional regulator [Mycobacterium sp. 1245111.1]|nr:XRE family transcriptional regulator [Mycobacterium sp. 1245111.1]
MVNGSNLKADEDAAGAKVPGTLADRLNRLFDLVRKPNEPPMSNAAASAAIKEKTGVSISAAYLWQLRNGTKDNPTVAHLRALAEFFGLPASYLVDTTPDPGLEAQLNLLQALRDHGVRGIALRASGLTPRALTNLASMIDHVRRLERLPPIEPAPPQDP